MTICTGACWSPARLVEEGVIPLAEAKYPLCGQQGVDEGHLFWECPKCWLTPTPPYKNQIGFVRSTCGIKMTLKVARYTGEEYSPKMIPGQWTISWKPKSLWGIFTNLVKKRPQYIPMGRGAYDLKTRGCADAAGHGFFRN